MPKYRVVWLEPGDATGRSHGTLARNSDEEIVLETKRFLQERAGWSAEIWRPDRNLLVATVTAPIP